jgi:formate dehydrogenase
MNQHFSPDEPKRGKGKKSHHTKGRQLDEASLAEVDALIDEGERKRDLLIEYLHLIQDKYSCLEARHLRALAETMKISMAEVYEVASFYDHFDIVKEGEPKPAPVTIRVCDSLSCMMAGAETLISELEAGADKQKVRIMRAPCMGGCDVAPAARVGDKEVGNVTVESLLELAASGSTNKEIAADIPDYAVLDAYKGEGGYAIWEKVKSGAIDFDAMLDLLKDSGLRGLGGAGFPSHMKWKFVRGYEGPRLMTINGDEGEPGTFKDRYYLERDPHRMFEGALIAAHYVEAERIYVYMRDEYPAVLEILRREIAALEEAGLCEKGFIELRRGAGAYICGEESAMIESIEGKRGLPRHRPPFIAEVGLFGRPTLNHNVETLYWIRDIVEKGADWFASQGKEGHPGPRSWSVSGRVKKPGVVFAPASMDDLALDFGEPLASLGSFVGSHAIVVLSDQDNVKDAVLNTLKFFKHESCGQCTPCRGGTEKMVAMLQKGGKLDEEAIADLEIVMRDASICGLGQAAPNPVRHLLTYFREDLKG